MAKKKGAFASPFVPVDEQPYRIPNNWCWIHLLDSFENCTNSKKRYKAKSIRKKGN